MNAYRRMFAKMAGALVLAGAFVVLSAQRADAALIVLVCDAFACGGGIFETIADGDADDLSAAAGRVSVDFGGGTVNVTANSYPSAGSPSEPFLSLTYDLDEDGFTALGGTPYFYAVQDGFTAPGNFAVEADASSGGGNTTVYTDGFVPIFACALDCTGFAAVAHSPFFLAIEVAPTAGTLGTARGDVTMTTVPDGGTTATLLGSVLLAVGMLRRRLGNG